MNSMTVQHEMHQIIALIRLNYFMKYFDEYSYIHEFHCNHIKKIRFKEIRRLRKKETVTNVDIAFLW